MSLILDALRKSEAERRRGETPGLFSPLPTPGAPTPNRPAIAPWLVAAAVLASAAVAWWLWPSSPPPTTPAPAAAPVAAAPAPVPAVVAAAPAPVAASDPAVRESRDAAPHDVVVPPTAAPATPAPAPTPEPVADEAEPPLEALPSLAVLAPSERAALPPLKLSMHVWSEAPNARLAIIDGQRVMEGSSIGESVVAEIRRDGVVLEWRGRRFLLSRP